MLKFIIDFAKTIYHELTREQTRLEIEIERHERAAERHRAQLDEWNDEFYDDDGGFNHCCHSCMTGGEWDLLQGRLERCEANLERMRKKQRSLNNRRA